MIYVVFDVEAIGLHGEGFAVGYVVINNSGETLAEGLFACPPHKAAGTLANREWVTNNVPALQVTGNTPQDVRHDFWAVWRHWADRGAALVADCVWPVEARFLAACVDDAHDAREWAGPYPLLDLASVLLTLGRSPIAFYERLPSELPEHHPLADARQSARLLIEVTSGT